MPVQRITREQVLAYRARAHALDERRPPERAGAVVGTCGIQDTPPGNADVALAARLDIDGPYAGDAVASRRLVLAWAMRGAPHLLSAADVAVFTLGAAPAEGTRHALWGQPEDALVAVEAAMVAVIGDEPCSKGEVSQAVTASVPEPLAPYCRGCDAHHPSESVFRAAPLLGRLVLASTAPVLLARSGSWLGSETTGETDALRTELVRRYLHAYAPTTSGHLAEWAGITKADAKQRWSALVDAVVPVDAGRRAYALEDDVDPLTQGEPVRGVRLLPGKDVYLQARDRGLLFPDPDHRRQVFRPIGGPGVVLVDGAPAGTWRGSAKARSYEVSARPFRELSSRQRAAVEEEAQRVALVRGHKAATISWG